MVTQRRSCLISQIPSSWMVVALLLVTTHVCKAQDGESDTNQSNNNADMITLQNILSQEDTDQPSSSPSSVSEEEIIAITGINSDNESSSSLTAEITATDEIAEGTTGAPTELQSEESSTGVGETGGEQATTVETIGEALETLFQTTENVGSSASSTISPTGSVTVEQVEESDETEVDDDPETAGLLRTLSRLDNVTSVEDLINAGLLFTGGRLVTEDDIRVNSSTGKKYISAVSDRPQGEIPHSDECSPRETSIRLTLTNVEASMIVFPRCIKELRCGGCCRVPHVSCVPMYTEERLYSLLLLRPNPNREGVQLDAAGFHSIRVVRHLMCQCKCSLTQESCGPLKQLKRAQCRCGCRNRPRCIPPRVFSEDTCNCECPTSDRICPGMQSGGNSSNQQASTTATPVPTTTTSTTTTTTATTEGGDSCANFPCPGNLHGVVINGGCVCRAPVIQSQRNPSPRPNFRHRSGRGGTHPRSRSRSGRR